MIKLSLILRERKFFVLFEQSSQNAVKIAQQLKDMVYTLENMKERVRIITDLEHQGMPLLIKLLDNYTVRDYSI